MKPLIPITDSAFKYTNAVATDVRKTFAKVRRELRQATEREQADMIEQRAKVRELIKGRV